MSSNRSRTRGALAGAVALAAGLLPACSSGSQSANPTTTAAPPTAVRPSTTTSSPTTTTTSTTTTTTEQPTTTTTVPAPPVYPLLGVALPDPSMTLPPALVVKIDNAPGARPQTGFNAADVVVEEI